MRGCRVIPSWAYFSFLLVTVSWSSVWVFICVINPSFISILEGLQEVFPLFLFVEMGENKNDKIKNAAKDDASSFSGTVIRKY